MARLGKGGFVCFVTCKQALMHPSCPLHLKCWSIHISCHYGDKFPSYNIRTGKANFAT